MANELLNAINAIGSYVDALDSAVNKFINAAPLLVQQHINSLAKNKLNTTYDAYMSAVSSKMSGSVLVVELDKDNWLANAVESGASAFDMKCIVSKDSKVYTSEGKKPISEIKAGDLVLTHLGKMQRVLAVFREKNTDDFVYKIETRSGSVTVTGNHPFLTNMGWVRAEELDEKVHKVVVRGINCKKCGKLIPLAKSHNSDIAYCSKSCAAQVNNEHRVGKPRTDLTDEQRKHIGEVVVKTNKRLWAEGRHASQPGDKLNLKSKGNPKWGAGSWDKEKLLKAQQAAFKALGEKSRGMNWYELAVFDAIISRFEGWQKQYRFIRDELYYHKFRGFINKSYYFDIAHPEHKIAIEINGEKFHTLENEILKQQEVESKGWRYLFFWCKDIRHNGVDWVADQVERVLMNHEEKYLFTEINFKKTKKAVTPLKYHNKYNLTVENDSSFVVSNIVTHNSGLLNSPKAKTNKQGKKFIIVPIGKSKFGTGGTTDKGQELQKKIQEVMLKPKFGPAKTKINPEGGVWETQQIINDVPELQGFFRSRSFDTIADAHAGKKKPQWNLILFRIVSENSPKDSWIHPGLTPAKIFEKTETWIDNEFGNILDNMIDMELKARKLT